MAYDIALNKAKEDFKGISPYVAASKSGTDFSEGKFRVKFFNRTFLVSHPEAEVEEEGSEKEPPQELKVLILHYITQADGTPVADKWITYRYLPGAEVSSDFQTRFMNLTINPLLRAFGNDIEGFKRGAIALGGETMNRTGDAAFRFMAFPKIPLACVLYLGDEEVQPSVSVLFDAAAPSYLPTEDLGWMATYFNTMQRYKTK
ncbi:MAG: DUF3786 domain-containing protein [Chloroflexota bacterium]